MDFICYPACTTCKKARTWLTAHNIAFEERNIKTDNPSAQEIRAWHQASGLPLKRFFNTSGQRYRELDMKNRIPQLSDDELYEILASDGMLVKRPLVIAQDTVLVGFKEAEWSAALL